MGLCAGIMKFLLIFFNLLFCVAGLGFIIVGALLLSNTSSVLNLLQENAQVLKTPQIIMIIVGIVIFIIASLGCCGAATENRCMLLAFSIFLISIFVVQMGVGIYAIVNKAEMSQSVEKGLEKEFKKINEDNKVNVLFSIMERDMECCGLHGARDYKKVPSSCCKDKQDCTIEPGYWPLGCSEVLKNFTENAGDIVGGSSLGLSAIEALGAFFGMRIAARSD